MERNKLIFKYLVLFAFCVTITIPVLAQADLNREFQAITDNYHNQSGTWKTVRQSRTNEGIAFIVKKRTNQRVEFSEYNTDGSPKAEQFIPEGKSSETEHFAFRIIKENKVKIESNDLVDDLTKSAYMTIRFKPAGREQILVHRAVIDQEAKDEVVIGGTEELWAKKELLEKL